jgi:lipopolysaccharide transport system ATP-binding protein
MMNPNKPEIKTDSLTEVGQVVIAVDNVSKKFCRDLKKAYLYGLKDVTAEIFGKSRKSDELRPDEFWALKDVTFEIAKGQSVGITGVNGSGKSTLLRMIAGLLKPDIGRIKVKGRVIPLSVLGAGFKANLTGKENVYVNMSIFGLSQREIGRKLTEVFDFAELWHAIDAPVRTYSSGMRARLGFACGVFTDPDILMVDEVLAVGDVPFRKKCYRKLGELKENGVSLVMVAHESASILSTCEKAIYLSQGKVIMVGEAKKVVKIYVDDVSKKDIKSKDNKAEVKTKKNIFSQNHANLTKTIKISSVYFESDHGNSLKTLTVGNPVSLCVLCEADQDLNDVSLNLQIKEISDPESPMLLLELQSGNDQEFIQVKQGQFIIKLSLPYCGLLAGNYAAEINLTEGKDYSNLLDIFDFFKFAVSGHETDGNSSFYQPRNWQIESI